MEKVVEIVEKWNNSITKYGKWKKRMRKWKMSEKMREYIKVEKTEE